MRCLYCGKECALLKRLTGGAKFCSDAHRKQYQKEYNDLALSRLLQSHPGSRDGAREAPPVNADPVPDRPTSASADPEIADFLRVPPSICWPSGVLAPPECDPLFIEPFLLTFPARKMRAEAVYSVPAAKTTACDIARDSAPLPPESRKEGLEFREWSRPGEVAAFPSVVPYAASLALSARSNEPCEFTFSHRLPHTPELWIPSVGQCPLPGPMLGKLADLDIEIVRGSGTEYLTQAAPRKAFTEPLAVTLQGVSAPAAKVVSIGSSVTSGLPEERLPPLPNFPLRPVMILRPMAQSARVAASASSAALVLPSLVPPVTAPQQKNEELTPTPLSSVAELGLPELRIVEDKGLWARIPFALKISLAACSAVAIVVFTYTAVQANNAAAKALPTEVEWAAGSPLNTKGWIEDWAPVDPLRRITMLRDTENYSNYRLEFTAQIQTKAIGWMFRGLNPKNFYVAKVEKIKLGLDPVVAFVRYAVIDGKNEARIEKILPMKVRADTEYKIRFEAAGSSFAIWIQGQKIDEWEDARLGSGGLGLYSESDEAAAIHGPVEAFELVGSERR